MAKLRSFIRLDFLTIKPYLTPRSLLIYAAVALFLSLVSSTTTASLSIGMMIGSLFVSYPFAVGEKSNLDALYATLSIRRKTVVQGRYLFALSFDLCMVLFSYLLSAFSLLCMRLLGKETPVGDPLAATIALVAAFVLLQAFQLPFYFKLGYAKAKLASLLPFGLLAGVYGLILGAVRSGTLSLPSFESLPKNVLLAGPLAALVLCALVFLSYRLSVAFYAKREF